MFKFFSNIKRMDPANPWLEEFCSELFDCKFPNDFKIDSKVEHVMDAVVLFTKTIDKFYLDNCRRNTKICNAIHQNFDGHTFFYNYLVNMDYEGDPRTCLPTDIV